MTGIGTVVNTLAIVAGGGLGLLLKHGISERFKEILLQALGVSTMFIGISGALRGIFVVEGALLDTRNTLLMIICLVLGALIGEGINIDRWMQRLGNFLKDKVRTSDEDSKFTEGFVTTTIIVCTGAMAIVGSFQDALLGDPAMLFAKSALDGVIAVILASTFGIGVLFAAIPLLIYQGSLTLLANWIKPILSDLMLFNIAFIGSLLVFLIGVNMLFGKRIRIANFLPAIVLAAVLPLIFNLS
ncbi:MAG: DUF554 domain-containing protein [Eubacteriales bacterium]|nr:DUF554 domain-containing protein [Eubacteriales bacterium]MDD4541935.1 DUF554 domain-containing protein [Eubacteriales bacterium]